MRKLEEVKEETEKLRENKKKLNKNIKAIFNSINTEVRFEYEVEKDIISKGGYSLQLKNEPVSGKVMIYKRYYTGDDKLRGRYFPRLEPEEAQKVLSTLPQYLKMHCQVLEEKNKVYEKVNNLAELIKELIN